jgi:hypothetical protein
MMVGQACLEKPTKKALFFLQKTLVLKPSLIRKIYQGKPYYTYYLRKKLGWKA